MRRSTRKSEMRRVNTKAKAVPAKATVKGKAKAPPVATEKRENRYLRAARIIIDAGDGVDLAELAVRAEMSTATAGHCLEAFKGVSQALREAKLLPQRAKAKAPAVAAPQAAEPVPA
jgi:hypothetical protein